MTVVVHPRSIVREVGSPCSECGSKTKVDSVRSELVCELCGLVEPLLQSKEAWAPLPSEEYRKKRKAPRRQISSVPIITSRVICGLCRGPLHSANVVARELNIDAVYECQRCPTKVTVALARGKREVQAYRAAEKRAVEELEELRREIVKTVAERRAGKPTHGRGRPPAYLNDIELREAGKLWEKGESIAAITRSINRTRGPRAQRLSESALKRRIRREGWAR